MADVVEDTESVVMLGVLAALGFGLYWVYTNFLSGNNPNSLGASVANAAGNVTNDVSSALASAFEALTFAPPINATGQLVSQAGEAMGPVSSFPAATYGGYTYLNVNGIIYQLGASSTPGDYTAIPTGVVQPASSTGGQLVAPGMATPALVAQNQAQSPPFNTANTGYNTGNNTGAT